ncbi:MAG: gliding motility-associated C-terminal domain-containing protein [Bacteroidota bacterium]
MKKIILFLSIVFSFQVLYSQPLKPGIPTGTTPICQGSAPTSYNSTGSATATSYQWKILPASAGAISGASTTGTVNWLPSFTGIAKIWLIAINASGQTSSDTLYVTVNPLPAKSGTPVGTSPICQNANNSFIVTTGATNAITYLWYLIPPTAGTITGTGTIGTVDWDSSFTGIARVIVYGVNTCGQGPVSDSIMITINPLPLKPSTPTGPSPLCIDAANTPYVTTGGTFASTYHWYINPSTAGTISGNTTTGTVDWSATFSGVAKIIVRDSNSCGNGFFYSDTLSVTITPLPGKPAIPTGISPVCQDAANSNFTTTGGTNATSYQWYILPAAAGIITGTTTTAVVDWNAAFSGIAKIFVRGVSSCGSSVLASDTLFVTVNPLPLKPGTPVGTSPICQGNPLTSIFATSGSTNAISYQWSVIPNTAILSISNGTTTTPTVTWNPAYSGIVRVIAFGVNACGQGPVSDSLMITIDPLPLKPTIPTGTSPLCMDAVNTDYSTTGSSFSTTYQWYILPATAGVITGTGLTGTVDWTSTFNGIAKIFVKGNNACGLGVVSDTLYVTINPLPGKPATPTGTTPVCQDAANTSYSTTGGTNAITYQWYLLPATAGIISGTTTTGVVDWNASFSGTAKIVVRGINNCGNGPLSSDTLFVTVNPLPGKPGTPVGPSPICQGTVSTIFATTGATNATSYLWNIIPANAGTITGTSTAGTVTWNQNFFGVVRIIVFGINACGQGSVSDSLMITINPLPLKPTIPVGPSPLCMDTTNTDYTTTASLYSNSYQWYILPATAGVITGTALTGTVDWTSNFSGIARIFVKGVNACGQGPASDTLLVTINPLPGKPTIPTGTTTMCQNAVNSTYSNTGGSNSTSYIWYIIPSTAGVITGTTTTSTVDWDSSFTGVAKIFVRGVNNCGNGPLTSDSISVTINPLPLKPATPTGLNTVCQDAANTTYTTTGSTYATSYVWSVYPTTAGVISGTTNTSSLNWDANFNGIAKIIVKGVNACGQSMISDTLFVTVTPLPGKPAIPTGTSPLCQDAVNTIYSTTGGTNATTYQWSILPATAGTITGTALSGTVDWSSSFNGIAKIFVKGVNSCGTSVSSDTLFVTITPLPGKPAIPTGVTPLCQDSPDTSYSTTGASSATSYQWYILPATAGVISGTTSTGVVNWSSTFTGIAKIFVLGKNACGNGLLVSDTLFVTINPLPGKPAIPTGTSPVCQNAANTTYNTAGGANCTTYQWSIIPAAAGTISGTTTSGTVDWSATFTGIAKIIVVGMNNCGQSAASDTLFITVNPLPLKPATPTGPSALCINAPNSTFTTTGGTNATSYQWAILPTTAGVISGNSTTGTVDWSNTFTGNVSISVTGVNSCGSSAASDAFVLTIHLAPTPNLGNDTSICTATSLVLSPGVFTSYKWQDSSTTPTFSIPTSGPSTNIYWVRVTQDGCSATDNVSIIVNDCEILLEMPNVFTPNGDGINDVFIPAKRKGITSMSTSIFNRWGKLIYKSDDLQILWDGKSAADGVYYWIINYTDMNGKVNNVNGSVSILR